jgi:hypothetical protein
VAVRFDRIAPVLPVRDVRRALDHYHRLGFIAEAYREMDGSDPIYGFVRRGTIELHLARTPELKIDENTSASYVYVDDADELYHEWKTASSGGRLTEPVDTPYGLREFTHWDPDGNLLRIGSPMKVDAA